MRILVLFAALFSVVHAITIPNLLGSTNLDTCAYINSELVVPDLQVGPGILIAVGLIDTCLCLSELSVFIETNVVGVLAVAIAGEQVVKQIISELINRENAAAGCYYPLNSIQVCIDGNPCGFICTNGLDPSPASNPTDCVCELPKQLCNGVCRLNCPSSTIIQRRDVMSCEFGLTPCGTTGSKAYECVNTKTSLESCGGCSIPLDAYSPRGRDCSTIPGVASVSCRNAGCVVHECMPGYAISYDKSTCYDEDQFSLAKEAVKKYRIASGFI